MPQYRKKPVVISAEQWTGGAPVDGMVPDPDSPSLYSVPTLEGNHHVTRGDFIITGVKGEKYPCKADIFALTYDPVES